MAAPKRQQEKVHCVGLTIRMTKTFYDEFRRMANQEGKGMSEIVRACIEKRVEKFKKMSCNDG